MTYTVKGTCGSGKTPCDVLVYRIYNGLRYYCVEGSSIVNATYDDIEDGLMLKRFKMWIASHGIVQ